MENSHNVTVLLERLSRVVQNEAHAEGLKPTQWEALRFLARGNRFSRTPSGLTAYLGMTKGTVSQTLIALERKDLVVKHSDAPDRRQVRLDVTPAGLRLLERDPIDSVLRSALTLPTEAQAGLAHGLAALLSETLRRRGGRPFGVCHTCRHFRANARDGAPHRCGLLDVPLTDDDSARNCIEHDAGEDDTATRDAQIS